MVFEKRARCWKLYQRKAARALGGGAVGRVGEKNCRDTEGQGRRGTLNSELSGCSSRRNRVWSGSLGNMVNLEGLSQGFRVARKSWSGRSRDDRGL